MADLKNQGYIESKPGPGGATFKKDLSEITLYEIYRTVTDDDQVLKFYDLPLDSSPFEKSIQDVSCSFFGEYIESFYTKLKTHSVLDIYNHLSIK